MLFCVFLKKPCKVTYYFLNERQELKEIKIEMKTKTCMQVVSCRFSCVDRELYFASYSVAHHRQQ